MKPTVLAIAIPLLLASCGQLDSSENNAPETSVASTATFPVQPVQVLHTADLRLSYIGKTTTDTSIFYQVVANDEGRQVGFNLSVPRGESGKARFSSRGNSSDNFLHLLQVLYLGKLDTTATFREDVWADYTVTTQNKLFFKEEGDSSVPELFLNINDKEHMIELREKDSIYRVPLLRRLTQPYGK